VEPTLETDDELRW